MYGLISIFEPVRRFHFPQYRSQQQDPETPAFVHGGLADGSGTTYSAVESQTLGIYTCPFPSSPSTALHVAYHRATSLLKSNIPPHCPDSLPEKKQLLSIMDSPSGYDQTNSSRALAHNLALSKAWFSAVKAHLARNSSAEWIDLVKRVFKISQNCAVWLFELFEILLTWAFSMLNPWTYTQTNPEPQKSTSILEFRLRSTESVTLTVPESFYLKSTGFLKGAVVLAIVMALKVWGWPIFVR
jgi:hypothetical protein